MAISFAQNYFRNSAGVQWEILGRLSLDNSYPTGGYSIDPLQFGLSQVTNFSVTDNVSGYGFDYNATTQKLLVYQSGAGGALPAHSHDLAINNVNGAFTQWRMYVTGVVGIFTPGETITGTTSTETAVYVGTSTAYGDTYLDFSSFTNLGLIDGEVITGGTSGATATTTSALVGVVLNPIVPTPYAVAGMSVSYNAITALSVCDRAVRLGTSAGRPRDGFGGRYAAAIAQLEISVVDPDSGFVATGYSVDYLSQPTSSVSAGTVTGGGEVTNGTDLSAITNVEYRVVGL